MIDGAEGMSIIELLVSSMLSMVLIGMTLAVTLANRRMYGTDVVRTRINQNLRGAFDIINSELRQAGERLPQGFPAIEIIDGAGSASDTLILRRNLLDETLTVCQTVLASTGTSVFLTNSAAGSPPACVYGSQSSNMAAWKTYRLAQDDDQTKAYIFDFGSKLGEYFIYDTETDDTVTHQMSVHSTTAGWHRNYPSGTSAIYILSEWSIALSAISGETDLLQLTENQDSTNVKNITYGVTSVSFRALMQDGTWKTSFTTSDNWTQLQAIEVTLNGAETYHGETITSSLTARLFPRNVLSN